jgi:hypothetical protein
LVTKRTAERLITTWRKNNECPSMVQPKALAYSGVMLHVDQNGVWDPRPGASSWKVDANGEVVIDRGG